MPNHKNCHHTMPTGENCKSPAVRGSDFCYFHGRPNQPSRASAQSRENPIDFPLIFDHEDILMAVNQSLQGLAANDLSTRRASILLMGIQMAAAQLSKQPTNYAASQIPQTFD
jgi:hypothetical protein